MRGASPFLLVVFAGQLAACGGGECVEGTVRFRDTCLAFDPFDKTPPVVTVSPPVRTRSVGNVTLTTDEPATIFVTTDDTTPSTDSLNEPDELVLPDQPNDVILRYFAVDLAGNRSAEQTVIWNIDQLGPAPPTGFSLALTNNANRSVTWTPPPDAHFGGVVVARVEGRLTTLPESGKRYAVGDTLEPGVTIVQIDDASVTAGSFSESMPAGPGLVRYVAWAFDDLLNYGAAAGAFDTVDLPTQFGTISVAAAGTVTVANAPSNITISGSTDFAAATTTLTATISLRNDTTRVLFAPKVLITNPLPGTITFANADGSISGKPFRSYGAGIPPGGSATRQWVFTGATAGTVLSLNIDIPTNPVLLSSTRSRQSDNAATSGSVVDQATGLEVDRLQLGPGGTRQGFGTRGGGFTPDGRIVVGARSSGAIVAFDLTTGKLSGTLNLLPQRAHVGQLVLDASGSHGYGLAASNHIFSAYNRGASATPTTLVRFDAATLTEHGRLDLGLSRNRDMRFSPDGKSLLIATGFATDGVIEVDLATFKIARKLTTTTRAEAIAFTPDGSLVVAGTQIELVDRATGTVTRTVAIPPGRRVTAMAFARDKLWVGRRDDTVVVDLAPGAPEPTVIQRQGRVLAVFDDHVYLGSSSVRRFDFDAVEDTSITFNFDRQMSHWLGRSPF